MPVYTYRREDGTTFDYRQKFLDDPLKVDPETGQHVVRVIQPAGVIFKGSGFYVNDSKSASHATSAPPPKTDKTESKTETKSEKPASKPAESSKSTATAGAAAD